MPDARFVESAVANRYIRYAAAVLAIGIKHDQTND